MFKGWDWTELAYKWGLYIPGQGEYCEQDELLGEVYFRTFIDQYIFRYTFGNQDTRISKMFCKDVRAFCESLSKFEHGYHSGVWKAISEIEDDFSLLQIFMDLIDHAWT